MTKQLIGTAVTDENGIATLQYKCGGRGEFQITAESGGLVSPPITVTDALFFDTGVTGTKNTNWGKVRVTDNVTSNGTEIIYGSDYGHYIVNSNSTTYSSGFIVEFDVVAFTDASINLVDSGNSIDTKIKLFGTGHYKFIVTDTGYNAYKDGEIFSADLFSFENVRVGFYLYDSNSGITFKNFTLVSYPNEVIKYTTVDYATSSVHNDSMWSSVTYFTRGEEYSILTNTSQVLMYTPITDNTGVVCDIMLDTTENDAFITVRNGSTSKKGLARNDLNLSNNVWYRLKVEINDSKVVFSVGSDSTTPFTLDEFNRLYFRTGANETMKLKIIGKYSI